MRQNKLLVQSIKINGTQLTGPLDPSINTLGDLINKVLPFLFMIAGIILLFVLISGGYSLMMSGGTPDKLKAAQGRITAGIIGFVLLVAAFLIVKFISFIFGFGGGII